MKHLVLGSGGQIGFHLVSYLKSIGEEVIRFDIVEKKEQDLRVYNNLLLENVIKECDFVHFLAFDIGGSVYMEKYQDTFGFIDNNIKIMDRVFSLLKKYNKPFIFASSQMSNMSYSTYGILKAIGEKYTKSLKGLVVKFWNVYGYEKDEEKSHVITDFIKMAQLGKIKMRTTGTELRQFLYGDDCADCLFKLSKYYNEVDRDEELHITNFKWTSIQDIATIIQEEINCKIIPGIKEDNVQKGKINEPNNYIYKYWKPKTTIKNGIKEIIKLIKNK
jgi:nucleoside-diphosphate-sugar epimerase|tara:strand:+ start:173 stop:997 length:825 start_codon:yes stop_codon:yes gene_type:complete